MNDQQVTIYGSGDHAKVIRMVLEENGYAVSEILIDDPSERSVKNNAVKRQKPSVKHLVDTNLQDSVFIAIRDNKERARIASALTDQNFITTRHSTAVMAPGIIPGDGSVILARAVVQPNVRIGKHVIINTGAIIGSSSSLSDCVHIAPSATINANVQIGEGTKIGAGAVIVPDVKIGRWCMIGAGTVVIKDVPDFCTVVGNPGRIIKREPPQIKPVKTKIDKPFDITFIGAGVATAYTLQGFLKKPHNLQQPMNIAVVDKNGEFFTGVPYGKRSGNSTLLLSPLKDFLPEEELNRFVNWLSLNKDWLLKSLSEDGGIRTNEWINKNRKKIDNGKWRGLFIPRSFFGYYTQETLLNAIAEAEKAGKAKIHFLQEEILNIRSQKKGYTLTGKSGAITSHKVVLGIGTPGQARIKTINESTRSKGNALVISTPYEKGMDQTIKQILHFVSKPRKHLPNVVLLGANASALELLYKMVDLQGIDRRVNKYYLVSSQGIIPQTIEGTIENKAFSPKHTLALRGVKHLTARDIAEAVSKDLSDAEALNISHTVSGEPVSRAFNPLLQSLDPEEKEKFACFYGNEIGRRQRVAGCHYTKITEYLKKEGRLEHRIGIFKTLVNTGEDALTVRYNKTCDHINTTEEIQADIVINCLGAVKLSDAQIPPIIHDLINSNRVKVNPSERGLRVNHDLEILPGVHVVGSLLTGNVIEGSPIWHAEHCGRVIELTKVLAKKLTPPTIGQKECTCYLKIHKFESERDIKAYTSLLAHYAHHPYYRYEYFAHHRDIQGELIILELRDQEGSLGIMPLLKRPVESEEYQEYFDVITPYGYSGPLFKERANTQSKKRFWQLLNTWYQKEKIVSEFIRFNHLNNHEAYDGELLPTLKNVKGKILKDKEQQWKNFKSKVRNNYRKAVQDHLSFKAFTGKEICMRHITGFHAIYIETMDRNHASSNYFFNLEYFKNLILSDPSGFILAFAYKGNTIVSAELIILHKDTMFAYLGGTRKAYFSSRPNDFLRVKVIDMGREKGYLWYILGGGIHDMDGLYKSKKYLFPYDKDFTFYTGRKIVNQKVYKGLCQESNVEIARSDAFFPNYRIQPKLYKVK